MSTLSSHLRGAGQICVSVFDNLKNSFTETEAENFQRLGLLFVETLVPNVVKCFKCLFPSQQVAEALGIGIGLVHKSNVFIFDVEAIRRIFPPESFPNLVLRDAAAAVGRDSDNAGAAEKEESGTAGVGESEVLDAEEAVKSVDLEPAGAVESGKLDTAEAVESTECKVEDDGVVQDEDVIIASSKPDSIVSAAKDSLDALNDHLEAASLTEKIAWSEDNAVAGAHSSYVKSLDTIVENSTAGAVIEDEVSENAAKKEIVEEEEEENGFVAISTLGVAPDLESYALNKTSETCCTSSNKVEGIVSPSVVAVDNVTGDVEITSGPNASDLDADEAHLPDLEKVSLVLANSELTSPETVGTGEAVLDEEHVSVVEAIEVTEKSEESTDQATDPATDDAGLDTETPSKIKDESQILLEEASASGASAAIEEAPQPPTLVSPSEEDGPPLH